VVDVIISYERLTKTLKKSYEEVSDGEFIVARTPVWDQGLKLVVRKIEDKSEIKQLEEEIKKEQAEVEKDIKKFAVIFYDNHIIFMTAKGLDVEKLRKDLSKISPAFIKKYKKFLKNPGDPAVWEELFDRSDIIEEFYRLYIKAREKILENVDGIYDDKKKEEFADNLLMQLLIIWYLQEKGFLNGDTGYLVNRFKDYRERGFDSYYKFLKELFEVMMSEPNDGIYHVDDRFGKIVVTGPAPFLNGEFEDAKLPEDVFYIDGKTDELKKVQPTNANDVPVINLFESRDWTEGNIDEYVLGAIFEKLMTAEDRQEKGAYYTREPITEYICNNTIKPHLVDRINIEKGTDYESLEEFFEEDESEEHCEFLFNLMQDLRILDPAVGSGHFLETAINVLVEIYEKIFEKASNLGYSYNKFTITSANEKGELVKESLLAIEDEEERKLKLKFHIILSRNIYGVDILPSAIRVARARMFMSLAKHFNARKGTHIRFPNVHFNLRVGNSLIGFADLDAFEKVSKQMTFESFFTDNGEKLDLELKGDLRNYIMKIDAILETKASPLFDEVKSHYSQELNQQRLLKVLGLRSDLIKIMLASLNTDYAVRLKKFIDDLTKRFNLRLNKEFLKYIESKGVMISENELEKIGFFHWVMEFSEVFLEKGGFDVVVGNPPHGAKISESESEIWKITYNLVEKRLDSAKTFIERSILLLKDNAPLSFVIPKPSTYSSVWEDFRNYILNFKISHCIDLGKAFENVKHEQIAIVIWKKNVINKFYLGGFYDKNNRVIIEVSNIPIRLVKTTGVLLCKLNHKEIAIAEYLIEQKFLIMESFDIFRGLPRKLSSENGERCIKGKDIGRYFIRFPHEFVDVSVNDNRIVRLKRKKIIAQNIVAHIEQTFDRIKIMAFPDMFGYLTFETVTNIVPEDEDVIKSTTLILNSRFVSWLVYSIIYNKAIRDMHFDDYFVRRILLPYYENYNIFLNIICDFILFLNADENIRHSSAEVVDFIDTGLADSLVYELYFKEKFAEDGLYPEPKEYLMQLVSKHLKPINYDRWAELYWKKQLEECLTSKEEKELEELEKKNMEIIEQVYNSIKDDKEIQGWIQKIKLHEWVKVIEGYN